MRRSRTILSPWGEQEPRSELACFGQGWDKGRPDAVSSHPDGRGPFGTLDQAGNVWEWCGDNWDPKAYKNRKETNPVDPVTTIGDVERRVLRGGGWYYPADWLLAAFRRRDPATYRSDDVGFRVAVAPASLGP